jgi:hypothetical protein
MPAKTRRGAMSVCRPRTVRMASCSSLQETPVLPAHRVFHSPLDFQVGSGVFCLRSSGSAYKFYKHRHRALRTPRPPACCCVHPLPLPPARLCVVSISPVCGTAPPALACRPLLLAFCPPSSSMSRSVPHISCSRSELRLSFSFQAQPVPSFCLVFPPLYVPSPMSPCDPLVVHHAPRVLLLVLSVASVLLLVTNSIQGLLCIFLCLVFVSRSPFSRSCVSGLVVVLGRCWVWCSLSVVLAPLQPPPSPSHEPRPSVRPSIRPPSSPPPSGVGVRAFRWVRCLDGLGRCCRFLVSVAYCYVRVVRSACLFPCAFRPRGSVIAHVLFSFQIFLLRSACVVAGLAINPVQGFRA